MVDPIRADELSLVECFELLSGHRHGRVVFTERALPAIRLVGYAMIGAHVVVVGPLADRPEPPWGDLAACLDGQVVAFEIDHADVHGAWSVVVTGTARALPASGELLAWGTPGFAGAGAFPGVAIDCLDVRGRRSPPALHTPTGLPVGERSLL